MKSYNVLLFVTLVAFSYSNAFEFAKLAEVKSLRSTTYGNNLIETLSLSLGEGGNIEQAEDLLHDLFAKLVKDTADAKAAWTKEEQRLVDLIQKLKDDIEKLKATIAADKASLAENKKLRDQAIVNLRQYNRQKDQNDAALKKNEENHEQDEASFKKSENDHSTVITAIQQVVDELKKLEGSVSGEARPDHVTELTAAEKRDDAYKAASFIQVSNMDIDPAVFVQMATTADQKQLHKLIGMLQSLKRNAEQSLEDDTTHIENSRAAHQTLKTSLEEDNVRLVETINEQKANLDNYRAEIARLTGKIAKAEKLLQDTINILNAAIKEKNDKEAQFKADAAEREEEKSTISRLQKIFEERLKKMSEFLKGNVNH